MLKALGRLIAFCGKEVNEIIRQPRLVLSLLLGPSIILLLFGIGYQNSRPVLDTLLVLPANPPADYPVEQIKQAVGSNFNVVGIESDQQAALNRLSRGEVDVVEVWPPSLDQVGQNGQKTPIEFHANEINPFNQDWIQYLAYAQITAINSALLTDVAAKGQGEAADNRTFVSDTRDQVRALRDGVETNDTPQNLERLERIAGTLAVSAAVVQPDARDDLLSLQEDLKALREGQQGGQLAQQRDRLDQIDARLTRLEEIINRLSSIPPDVLVSPLYAQYQNMARVQLDAMRFYAPAVLALLVQHMAVALGALSLVRERLLGSMELFRVSPVTPFQLLVGKYLGYVLFISGLMAVLVLLLVFGLQVPFLGNWAWFVLEALLLVLASLGVGFTISSISSSDSQAVQLSMLVLLLSIFFGGFFLPLDSFAPWVRGISYALPLTHGIMAFQSEMLMGAQPPGSTAIIGMGAIALLTFCIALVFTGQQFRRI